MYEILLLMSPYPGATITAAANDAVAARDEAGEDVALVFNDTYIRVRPDMTADDVVDTYFRRRNR